MSYTSKLAEYVADLKFEQIPEDTVLQTKKVILHVLSAALASASMPQAKAAAKIAMRKSGDDCASVWGTCGKKSSAEDAAFANATMADILDWEDCSWTGHPSAGAVSVALALGEAKHRSGKEVIEAIVAAYDVYQRFAMSVQPRAEEWGQRAWGLTSWQMFAGSIAAAKLYHFDREKVATCIGVTTHFVNVPGPTREDSDIYHYAHGISARNGIAAAEIVDVGVDPIRYALDGVHSFGRQLNDTVDSGWYEKELGKWFAIDDTFLKHWPANMWIQVPLDIWDELIEEYRFNLDDIESIEVSPEVGLYSKPISRPNTVMKAEFNLAYCFAARLKDREPSFRWYGEENISDPQMTAFARKLVFLPPIRNPLEQFQVFWAGEFPEATVYVKLKDGRVLTKTKKYPKGHPKNNYSWQEECAHFDKCAAVLPEEKRRKVMELTGNLEQVEDVAALCEQLVTD